MAGVPTKDEIEFREKAHALELAKLKELAAQRRSSTLVGIVSAIVVLFAALGSQWITQDCADRSKETIAEDREDDDYLLTIGESLVVDKESGEELTGVYLFHPDTGRVWLGKLRKAGEGWGLEWTPVPVPSNETSAPDG